MWRASPTQVEAWGAGGARLDAAFLHLSCAPRAPESSSRVPRGRAQTCPDSPGPASLPWGPIPARTRPATSAVFAESQSQRLARTCRQRPRGPGTGGKDGRRLAREGGIEGSSSSSNNKEHRPHPAAGRLVPK